MYRTNRNTEFSIILDFTCTLEDLKAYASWIRNFVYASPYIHIYNYSYIHAYIHVHVYALS